MPKSHTPAMDEGGGPFRRDRLMGYHGQLTSSLDAGTAIANSVALAPGLLFAPVAALAEQTTAALTGFGTSSLLPSDPSSHTVGSLHSPKTWCLNGPVPATNTEIESLKSEIAGVQCALAYMKGADEISTLGKKLGRRLTQEQLRKRAELVSRSLNELPLKQYIKAQHRSSKAHNCISPEGESALAAQYQQPALCMGSQAESMSRPQGYSNSTHKPTSTSSSTMGTPHCPASALSQRTAAPYNGSQSEGGGRLMPLVHPATETCRQTERCAWSAGGAAPYTDTAASVATQHGFETLTADQQASPRWRRNRPVAPVGKGEAVILEAALDEALPAGALTAKYTQPAYTLMMIIKQHISSSCCTSEPAATGNACTSALLATDGPAQTLAASQDMRTDWVMLDSVMREAARQVAASCAERGRLLLKVGERYSEAYECLSALIAALHASNTALATALGTEQTRTAQLLQTLGLRNEELAAKQAALEERDFQMAALKAELEHSKWDHQQEVAALTQQNQILSDRLIEAQAAVEQERLNSEETLAQIKEALEAQIASLTDERDDLLGRVRFLQRQVAALRHGAGSGPALTNAVMQTEPVEWYSDDDQDGDELGLDATNGFSTVSVAPAKVVKQKRRPRDWLGGFDGLISSNRQGRIRGLQWTQAAITQIYADKIVQDAIADRDLRPRARICEFILEWHLNKYGLVQLAEANVLDLIASTRHHAKTLARINWFAQFIGLQELTLGVTDTTQHLSFYLFLLQQLAFPHSLACLFPEHNDTSPARISTAALPEVTKAVFRYVNDAEQAKSFMAQVIEPMVDPDPTNPDGPNVPLDALVRVYMAEYQQRYSRATSHLTSLFQAGDADVDGFIDYDTLTALIDVAAPDAPERLKAGLYSEAMRALPAGHHRIPCGTWLNVTRTFGFDRWKVDPTALAAQLKQAMSPGQLLSQGPGVLPLLCGVPPAAGKATGTCVTAAARHQRHESMGSGPLIARAESTRQVNRSIWGVLLSSLRDLEPSLPSLVQAAMQAVPSHSSILTLLRERASHFSRSLAALPTSKGSPAIESILAGLADLGCSGQQSPAIDAETASVMAAAAASSVKRAPSMHPSNDPRVANPSMPVTPNTHRRATTAATATTTARGSTAAAQRSLESRTAFGASMGTGVLSMGSQANRLNTTTYWDTRQVVTSAHSPADAPQAWLAFQLLFAVVQEALSGQPRPVSPLQPGSCSPGSRPGSPAPARRNIIMPAMPWRNGRLSPVAPIPTSMAVGGRASGTVSVLLSGPAANLHPNTLGEAAAGTAWSQEDAGMTAAAAAPATKLDTAAAGGALSQDAPAVTQQQAAPIVMAECSMLGGSQGIVDEVSRAYLGTRLSDLTTDDDAEEQVAANTGAAAPTAKKASGQAFTGFPLVQ